MDHKRTLERLKQELESALLEFEESISSEEAP
jgi:hypothetical protein